MVLNLLCYSPSNLYLNEPSVSLLHFCTLLYIVRYCSDSFIINMIRCLWLFFIDLLLWKESFPLGNCYCEIAVRLLYLCRSIPWWADKASVFWSCCKQISGTSLFCAWIHFIPENKFFSGFSDLEMEHNSTRIEPLYGRRFFN